MHRMLISRNGQLASSAAQWLCSGVMLLAVLHATAVSAWADDTKSARLAQREKENPDEDGEMDGNDEVDEEPDRFRRASRRRKLVDSKPVRTPPSFTEGVGVIGQVGHLAFKTFGRNESITPIEMMPYILTDEHFFFADLRGFISNSATAGGNAGLGYRNLREDHNAWYGASVWYDADATTGKLFQQVGISLEGMIDRFELRSNVYLPTTSNQTFANTVGNTRIVGNQLLYSRFIDQGKGLRGVDIEAGYNLPVNDPHRVRGFVGYYRFDGGPSGAVNGFKARVEAVINNNITAQVMYTNDPLFGSNMMVGGSLQFPWGKDHPGNKWKQNTPSPFRFVERNYNVIVDRGQMTNANTVAYNPQAQAPYIIEQVNPTASSGGNGTFASPFQSISQAQAAGGNVILVQGNSVLTTGATLTTGQYLLGDGSSQPLPLAGGLGMLYLPAQIVGGVTPQFNNVNGPAVVLAANSEVAGFNITNNLGDAVVGNNIAGSTIRDVTFQNITGDALRITNSTGDFVLQNVAVNTTIGGGNGISFIGGTPNLLLSGSVNGTNGDGILVSGLTGGSVNINNTSIQSTGGAGLNLTGNTGAAITVNSLTTTGTSGPAVSVSGGATTDTYHFGGTTTINTPSSTGFYVNNGVAAVTVDNLVVTSTANSPGVSLTNSTGIITLSNLTETTTNGVGLYGRGLTSLVVSAGSLTATSAGAIDVQNSLINMNLSQVSVNGMGTAPFGIQLLNNTGRFNLTGGGAYASGGTIQNTTAAGVILGSTGTVAINGLDLTSNNVGIQSNKNSQVTLSGLRINSSTNYAINSLDDTVLMVENSIFASNGALGGGTILAHVDTLSSYQWLIQGNNITDINGTAIMLQTETAGNGASLATTVQSNTINASRAGAALVDINWNGPLSAAVAYNVLNAGAANMTGVIVQDLSVTDSVTANVDNNSMTFAGSMGTGLYANASAGSSFQVYANNVQFNGVNGTGLRFNMGGINTSWIYSNIITDAADGATGMLFDNVAASSRLQIEANTINLLSTDLTPHRGIFFMTVSPTIQFAGNYNNIITNTSTPFSIPVNSSTGHIIVNGIFVP